MQAGNEMLPKDEEIAIDQVTMGIMRKNNLVGLGILKGGMPCEITF